MRYDPDDPDQVEVRQTAEQAAQEQRAADWRWLTRFPQGRRILRELLIDTGLMSAGFSENPIWAAFSQGKREIGASIYTRVTQACEGASLPALLAEVIVPDVRNDQQPGNQRGTRRRRG